LLSRGVRTAREQARGGVLAAAGAVPADGLEDVPAVGSRSAASAGESRRAPLWSDDRPPFSDAVFSDAAFAEIQDRELVSFVTSSVEPARSGADAEAGRDGGRGEDGDERGFERALEELLDVIEG